MKRRMVCSAAAALLAVVSLSAQTVDLARVTAGFSIGRVQGIGLWDIGSQKDSIAPGALTLR